MKMAPRARKLALITHVTLSVGWLGAVVAYLALAIGALVGGDDTVVRASYVAMERIAWWVIVPCSVAALVVGIVQGLGTDWGLVRHRWVLTKLVLTSIATLVLLVHVPTVGRVAAIARDATMEIGELGPVRLQLVVHAAGGLLVLLTATAISIVKPWGKTRWASSSSESRWTSWGPVAVIAVVVIAALIHLAHGGPGLHH